MTDVVSSGLHELDEELGGGIPAGSIVVVTAPPESASELIGQTIAVENQPSRYVSTVLSESLLNRRFDELAEADETDASDSDSVGVTRAGFGAVDELESGARSLQESGQDVGALVVDSMTDLVADVDRSEVRETLDGIREAISESDAVAVLVVETSGGEPVNQPGRLVLRAADVVMTYRAAEAAREEDTLTLRRVRTTTASVSELPATISLSIGATLEESPDNSF